MNDQEQESIQSLLQQGLIFTYSGYLINKPVTVSP